MSGVTKAIMDEYIEPLAVTYALTPYAFPDCQFIKAEVIPQPYRELLAHDQDMTPTLERFHGETTELQVKCKQRRNGELLRQVVLVTQESARHVEFGAICISLNLFEPTARAQILDCHIPLGSILHINKIEHYGKPTAFFKLTADDYIQSALEMDRHETVYGRCNAIYNSDGIPLARIVEILPSIAK